MFELLTLEALGSFHRNPEKYLDEYENIKAIESNKEPPYSHKLTELIRTCLNTAPDQRPAIEELRKQISVALNSIGDYYSAKDKVDGKVEPNDQDRIYYHDDEEEQMDVGNWEPIYDGPETNTVDTANRDLARKLAGARPRNSQRNSSSEGQVFIPPGGLKSRGDALQGVDEQRDGDGDSNPITIPDSNEEDEQKGDSGDRLAPKGKPPKRKGVNAKKHVSDYGDDTDPDDASFLPAQPAPATPPHRETRAMARLREANAPSKRVTRAGAAWLAREAAKAEEEEMEESEQKDDEESPSEQRGRDKWSRSTEDGDDPPHGPNYRNDRRRIAREGHKASGSTEDGDDPPHGPNYRMDRRRKNELGAGEQ